MEPVTWGFVGTIVGTIVGATASIATSFIAANNSLRLQKDAESLERVERARQFQRNNFLALQEAMATAMRLVGQAHLEDLESYRKNPGTNKSPMLSEALDQDIASINRQLSLLTERVSDDSLRELFKTLRTDMTVVVMARSESESNSAIEWASNSYQITMEKLGEALRSSY